LRLNDYGLSDETKAKIKQSFNNLLNRVNQEKEIYRVDAIVAQSLNLKERAISVINKEIEEWKRKKEREQKEYGNSVVEPPVAPKPKVETQVVNVNNLVEGERLTSEEEVDAYINTLSRMLKDIIKANKHIEFQN